MTQRHDNQYRPNDPAMNMPPQTPYGQPQPQEPKKRNWFARHKVLTGIGIAVIVIGIFSTALGGGEQDSPDVPVAEEAQVENAVGEDGTASSEADLDEVAADDSQEAEPASAEPGIGDPVLSGDLEFTVTGIENGGTEIGSEYLSETAQGEFILVHVEVTNTGDAAASFFGGSQTLIDSEGREHKSDGTASLYIPDNDTLFAEINPGNTVVGTLVFDLAVGTEPVEILLQGGLFDSDVSVNVTGQVK